MNQKEFLDHVNLHVESPSGKLLEMSDFEYVRRPVGFPIDTSKVLTASKALSEWHWRMFSYRLLFKVPLEHFLLAFPGLIDSEPHENCKAYLLQIIEERITKTNATRVFESIHEKLHSIPGSVQRSLLLAKLLQYIDNSELIQLAISDIRSGNCSAGALKAYQKLGRIDLFNIK